MPREAKGRRGLFPEKLSFSTCVPQKALRQAERVRQQQTEHLSLLVQHQQLQQHHGGNGTSGGAGDGEGRRSQNTVGRGNAAFVDESGASRFGDALPEEREVAGCF